MVLQFVGEYVAAFLLKNPSSKMKGFFVRLLFYNAFKYLVLLVSSFNDEI